MVCGNQVQHQNPAFPRRVWQSPDPFRRQARRQIHAGTAQQTAPRRARSILRYDARIIAITEDGLEPLAPLAMVVKHGGDNDCAGYLLRERQAGDDLLRVVHDMTYMLIPGYGPVLGAASFTGPVAPTPESSRSFIVFTLVFLGIRFGVNDAGRSESRRGSLRRPRLVAGEAARARR